METITNSQYKIIIDKDETCESPRTHDNLGTMVCFHRRYDLSDRKHGYTTEEIRYSEETGKLLGDEPMIFLPVYGYDHGGMAISTTRTQSFSDSLSKNISIFMRIWKSKTPQHHLEIHFNSKEQP